MTTDLVPLDSAPLVPHTAGDLQLIGLWLHGRSPRTQQAYAADAKRLLAFTGKPLQAIGLLDLQQFADSLTHLALSSQKRILSSAKSLLTFAHRAGYTAVNAGAPLRLPKTKDTLAERILTEEQVQSMLALERNRRNHALLRLIYSAGLRVSEAVDLHWRDVQSRGDAGQVTVFGKGSKTRAVLLSSATWRELLTLRGDAPADAPVFVSRKGNRLAVSQAWRVVKAAAKRAGLPDASPHWLRHAHASHALDRGAPISLVKETLGHSDVSTTGRYLHARPDDSSARYLGV